ncbi:S8 family serine peptidase [Patiriisocius marinus]|uniref:S8 family serine peptidase n=1 Tax=Patiriisocius marinus TaxID=1397112 RepID=UPI00232E8337|nr:S8 family serine peptidase [Patiriisocius marinus]
MKNNYSLFSLIASGLLLVSSGALNAQTTAERLSIQNKSNVAQLTILEADFNQQYDSQKQSAIQLAQSQNIPVKLTLEDGGFAELQRFAEDGSPIYYRTFNVAAARSTRANHLNIGGSLGLNLDGQNMTAYVWDGGHARASHQEYDGAGGTNRVTIQDAASEGGTQLNFHAAHVTGTITASGVQASAKGMAPQSKVNGYMWNNDVAEATAAAANGMLLSNHSYGFRSDLVPDQYFGAYIQDSRDWDNVMYNAPYYLMVVAAGNDGSTNYNGNPLGGNSAYDKLTGHATSKNNMVVANAQDANIANNGDLISVSINSSSSEGPTDDYRIKPDITGNGTSVYSTYESSNTAYASITGTSMASPNVTGSLLLLQQHYNSLNGSFMRSATLKGVALHTADDAGATGPDAIYGWGLMNTKKAAEVISANGAATKVEERVLNSGQSYSVQVQSDGVNDLFASISWTDVAGAVNNGTNSGTAALVNDLDVRVTQGGATFSPWRLTGVTTNGKGDNTKDNYERVEVANASGTYTITVTHKGSLSSGSQAFSLIVTGLGNSVADTQAPSTPTSLVASGATSSTVGLNWNASTDNVAVSGYDVYQGTNVIATVSGTSYTVTGLSPSTAYSFRVRAKDAAGNVSGYSNTANATTTVQGITYCSSASTNTNDEYISRVQLNTINNASGAQFYSDFTNISTTLSQGNPYTVTVTPTWTGTIYDEAYAVWIDYNKDGDFTDAGELVWSKAPSKDTPNSGSFTIPTSASLGATRMRVAMQYNAIPTSCQSFTYGEVEDYTVTIAAAAADTQAPSNPTNLTASNIAETSVTLNWTASTDNVGVVAYDVYQGTALLGEVTGTSANVTGLIAATGYSFNVRAKDAAGNISGNSNTLNITTPGGSSGGCINGIAAFPYSESFESGLGSWSQSSDDDIDWTRDSGGTPSSSTGPSNGASGTWYMFVEASGSGTGYPNKRAILDSPCLDLSGETQAFATFSYHMYGAADMGSITLEASSNNGSSWTALWTKTGNQGNTWLEETVDLSAYTGGNVQLRFNRLTGATWQADIAIDNFRVATSVDQCAGVAAYNSSTSYSTGDRVTYNGSLYERTTSGWTNLGSCGTQSSNSTQSEGITNDGPPVGNFTMYPNPVTQGVLNIEVLGSTAKDYVVYNLTGQVVLSGAFTQTLDVSLLASGVYMLEVHTDQTTFVERFVKE